MEDHQSLSQGNEPRAGRRHYFEGDPGANERRTRNVTGKILVWQSWLTAPKKAKTLELTNQKVENAADGRVVDVRKMEREMVRVRVRDVRWVAVCPT